MVTARVHVDIHVVFAYNNSQSIYKKGFTHTIYKLCNYCYQGIDILFNNITKWQQFDDSYYYLKLCSLSKG